MDCGQPTPLMELNLVRPDLAMPNALTHRLIYLLNWIVCLGCLLGLPLRFLESLANPTELLWLASSTLFIGSLAWYPLLVSQPERTSIVTP